MVERPVPKASHSPIRTTAACSTWSVLTRPCRPSSRPLFSNDFWNLDHASSHPALRRSGPADWLVQARLSVARQPITIKENWVQIPYTVRGGEISVQTQPEGSSARIASVIFPLLDGGFRLRASIFICFASLAGGVFPTKLR